MELSNNHIMPNKEEEERKAGEILLEIIMLLVAFGFAVTSYLCSQATDEAHWFARSGAVVVLLSVWVETRNYAAQQRLNDCRHTAAGFIGGSPQDWSMPRRRKILEYVTLFMIVMGTLIWGYGDLAV